MPLQDVVLEKEGRIVVIFIQIAAKNGNKRPKGHL